MKRLVRSSVGLLFLATLLPSPCHSLLLRQDSSSSPRADAVPTQNASRPRPNLTKKLQQAKATSNYKDKKPLQSVPAQLPAQSNVGKKERPPRIHFLFIAIDKILNWPVWEKFFLKAEHSQFRAFVHCKTAACLFFATDTKLLEIVRTVPSTYCTDLVSPMNQLLDVALNDDPASSNPRDKFIFVSDSTLPSKSFPTMYHTLTKRKGSDICVYPSKDWADIPMGNGQKSFILTPKAHQWMVLERPHAHKATATWRDGVWRNLPTFFKLNSPETIWQKPNDRTYGDTRNFGCLDEFWHMAAIFGPLVGVDRKTNHTVDYPGFTNSPLLINPGAGWQGTCDTFALWSDFLKEPMVRDGKQGTSSYSKLLSALDASSIPHTPSNSPAWWDRITPYGMTAIRKSDFLFVRKFVEGPQVVGGGDFVAEYTRIVLEDAPSPSRLNF